MLSHSASDSGAIPASTVADSSKRIGGASSLARTYCRLEPNFSRRITLRIRQPSLIARRLLEP